ncbi:AUGMIN subunit 2-like isoform X2 [Acanthaster planci]|nr:AUGMIN subunit 2-like isoform X2 [Acanthaster planci]XP_022080322.1 AUGMIN subunit 2-like isoform X2 [Acanthaster planci]XP_022080323.1 AUGMIN subunit 2-like isoform X2 [Acanthaster planci]
MMEVNDKNAFQLLNPWISEDRTTAAVCSAIRLAEQSGHLKTRRDEVLSEMVQSLHNTSPSLRLIQQLKEMTAKGQQLDKINMEIQSRLMDKETRDIMHLGILESKISQLDSLSSHLQAIVQSKDHLINRLQQPFVGDYLKIEAAFHMYVKELFPLAASCLAELSSNLQTIQWASGFDTKDGKMDKALMAISASLAHLQTSFQTICQLRNTLDNLESQASGQVTSS